MVALIVGPIIIDACLQSGNSGLTRDVGIVFGDGVSGEETLDPGSSVGDASEDEPPEGGGVSETTVLSSSELIGGKDRVPRGCTETLPSRFTAEVIGRDGFEEAFFTVNGSVVGFIGSGTAADTFSRISDELIGKGWVRIESGQAVMGTFVKVDGMYTWVMVSCTEAADKVGTVIQFRKVGEYD